MGHTTSLFSYTFQLKAKAATASEEGGGLRENRQWS